ncbi:acyltransferase [Achromobacter sp. ACRQX]|uniref:acyltransferase family protein n=1 Tax=Achromobacter sp. ACRQX TaxID=2918181 RepID=UPI001EF20B2E|nr:acyltransferase [Achromobacter sp. ACRQX]MCG7328234.1 acyltransferase [Achromobacter sp. ACRQX]
MKMTAGALGFDAGLKSGDQGRLFYLDAIRVLAIVLIVLYHFNIQVRAQAPDSSVVGSMTVFRQMMGDLGVTLFIIISGASLGLTSAKWKGAGEFYLKRALAIYPPFWTAWLSAALVLYWLSGSWPGSGPTWKAVLTVTGFDGFFFYIGPNFYLVGEWFVGFILCLYALFPALRAAVFRWPLLTWIAVGALVYLLFRNYASLFSIQVDRNPLMRLPEFLFGVCVARYVMPHKLIAFIVSLGTLAFFAVWMPPIHILFYGLALGIACFCVLAYAGSVIPVSGRMAAAVSKFAQYSFLVFLVHHQVIYVWLPRVQLGALSSTQVLLLFCGVLLMSFIIAAILDLFVSPLTKALRGALLDRRFSADARLTRP